MDKKKESTIFFPTWSRNEWFIVSRKPEFCKSHFTVTYTISARTRNQWIPAKFVNLIEAPFLRQPGGYSCGVMVSESDNCTPDGGSPVLNTPWLHPEHTSQRESQAYVDFAKCAKATPFSFSFSFNIFCSFAPSRPGMVRVQFSRLCRGWPHFLTFRLFAP